MADGSPPLVWRSHPFRRQPVRGLAVLGVVSIIATGLGWATHSLFWALFAGLLLVLSLEGFYFPTRYEIGQKGVTVRRAFSRSTRDWASFRRVYEDKKGLTLSPYRRKTLLEPYRSIRLLFDGGIRADIRSEIQSRTELEWVDLGATKRRSGKGRA